MIYNMEVRDNNNFISYYPISSWDDYYRNTLFMSGTTQYGADRSRRPPEDELKIAHFQGEYVAKIAKRIAVSSIE
ncbi:MAG: hypothetical protein WBG30_11590 [Psychrilyobacter sp.]|uniref:hypothetical protein n=1 Tax=Psychrilyobacter sp. TaxID=2586924 RepID=UPI003C75735E